MSAESQKPKSSVLASITDSTLMGSVACTTANGLRLARNWVWCSKKISTKPLEEKTQTIRWGSSWYGTTETYERKRYYMTVGEFCKANPEGVFLCTENSHLFVINNGVVMDPNMGNQRRMRRFVRTAYRVHNSVLKPIRPKKLPRNPLIKFERRPYVAHSGENNHARCYEEAYRTWLSLTGQEITPEKERTVAISWKLLKAHTSYTRVQFRVDLRQGNVSIVEED